MRGGRSSLFRPEHGIPRAPRLRRRLFQEREEARRGCPAPANQGSCSTSSRISPPRPPSAESAPRSEGRRALKLDQVNHLNLLQKENTQLKKLVADLSLDNAVLKEAKLTEIALDR